MSRLALKPGDLVCPRLRMNIYPTRMCVGLEMGDFFTHQRALVLAIVQAIGVHEKELAVCMLFSGGMIGWVWDVPPLLHDSDRLVVVSSE